jgi:hypothetical protein
MDMESNKYIQQPLSSEGSVQSVEPVQPLDLVPLEDPITDEEEKLFEKTVNGLPIEERNIFFKSKIDVIGTLTNEGFHGASLGWASKKKLLGAILSGHKDLKKVEIEILPDERERNRNLSESLRIRRAAEKYVEAGSPKGGSTND